MKKRTDAVGGAGRLIALEQSGLCRNCSRYRCPTFTVKLDDVAYENQHAKYPLLVYQDVTYFPMTYQLTRSLGLVTGWDEKQGLYIAQHKEAYSEEADDERQQQAGRQIYGHYCHLSHYGQWLGGG